MLIILSHYIMELETMDIVLQECVWKVLVMQFWLLKYPRIAYGFCLVEITIEYDINITKGISWKMQYFSNSFIYVE